MMFINEGKMSRLIEMLRHSEMKVKREKKDEPNKPKVDNTYGVSVNPLTGKMERKIQEK
tara:strand:+ start:354 stop:530 length:177 start_codon:yes stop_codon:yes gene_type:complete